MILVLINIRNDYDISTYKTAVITSVTVGEADLNLSFSTSALIFITIFAIVTAPISTAWLGEVFPA